MFTLNSIESLHFLESLFFPFFRILAFISVAPVFGETIVNSRIKIVLSFLISFLIFPFIPKMEDDNLSFFSAIIVLIEQILLGYIFGFVIKMAFSSLEMAGEIISSQMGLSFSNFFDIRNKNSISLISHYLKLLTYFLFLEFNGHLAIIFIICNSFYDFPVSNVLYIKPYFFSVLVNYSTVVFLNAIRFSFPVFLTLLVLNVILAILNRISPQISIFSVGFPITLFAGMFLIYTLVPISILFFKRLFLETYGYFT
ncbi:Flagellar biosynthetic protein FliR [Buchnera aphidicola (Tetraneura ulmi)]|uniref:flagellar biosynthetic protein FliR n=1 Tax=Buchnera aphidicola TaxID=9 RepID=UPI0034649686